ncbi:MAG: glycogen/starch/alpha-glucan phosphorylase, partial [Candidatus Izemoplasmatales bacterium]
EVTSLMKEHTYRPNDIYQSNERIHQILDLLVSGFFEDVDKEEFREIFNRLVYDDTYFVLRDFDAYCKAHEKANEMYKDKSAWARMSIVNIAKSGIFSSDRSIQDYANLIWKIKKVK